MDAMSDAEMQFHELSLEELEQISGGKGKESEEHFRMTRSKYGADKSSEELGGAMASEETKIHFKWMVWKPGDPIKGTILEGTLG